MGVSLRQIHILPFLCGVVMLALAGDVQAQELDGEWTFELTAPEGSHSFSITLAVDGEEVTGTAGDDETFSGTLKDGELKLSGDHYVDEVGYSATIELSGTLDGDTIKGTATWDTYEVTVFGTRKIDGAPDAL